MMQTLPLMTLARKVKESPGVAVLMPVITEARPILMHIRHDLILLTAPVPLLVRPDQILLTARGRLRLVVEDKRDSFQR